MLDSTTRDTTSLVSSDGAAFAAERAPEGRAPWRRSVGLLFLLAALGAGCSNASGEPSNTGTGAPPDAGLDSTLKCGEGGLMGVFRTADATTLGPLAGVTLTGASCDVATSDDSGIVEVELTQGELVKVHVSASGFIPEHVEATPKAAGFDRTAYLFPDSLRASVFSGWTAGSGYALVAISASKGVDAGGCAKADGLVASVNDHPELVVAYLTDAITRSPTLEATSAFGVAVIGPIPPGIYEMDAEKAGCVAGPDQGKYFTWPQTVEVEADALSIVQLGLP